MINNENIQIVRLINKSQNHFDFEYFWSYIATQFKVL